MQIIEYTPRHAELLRAATSQLASRNLRNRDFVNHYYASSPWCRLYLLVSHDDVAGVVGVERMPFRRDSRQITVGFGTNYYSLKPGAGGFLFLHWMKSCDLGISFGGSPDAHHVIRSQKWPYFEGIGVYLLNNPFQSYPGQPLWKRAAKWVARQSTRRRIATHFRDIPARVLERFSVREEIEYTEDLLPKSSPFDLRFTPSAAYLSWRYATRLPFVRYRLFRILDGNTTAGYVILNDTPDRVVVAQCDGEDPEAIAWGVVLSVLKIAREDRAPRTVMLTCCHPAMQEVYKSVGFKKDSTHPFALGSLRPGIAPPADAATSNWLVNFDWGDNGLLDC